MLMVLTLLTIISLFVNLIGSKVIIIKMSLHNHLDETWYVISSLPHKDEVFFVLVSWKINSSG